MTGREKISLLLYTAVITGLNEDTLVLSGTYSKKVVSPEDEFAEFESYVDRIEMSEGGMMY